MNLSYFSQKDFYKSLKQFFNDLNIPINPVTEAPDSADSILSDTYNANNSAHKLMEDVYFVGMVSEDAFTKQREIKYTAAAKDIKTKDYDCMLLFGVTLKAGRTPSRSQLAEIIRAFNRQFSYYPVVVIFKYGEYIAFANCERLAYKQAWRGEGERPGKVSLLKDISFAKPHSGHLRIMNDLQVSASITRFAELHACWRKVLSVDKLNADFYRELSAWYYYAIENIKLPISSEFAKDDKENVKNFVIRLICRTLFCWFLKEKGLIQKELLELYDDTNNRRTLVKKMTGNRFDSENSYYRGILQNVFFACLNTPMKERSKEKYYGKKYLMDGFDFGLFSDIPFLNGGLFSKLEEDNCNDRYDDGPLNVPNELFYAEELTIGTGRNMKTTEGLNRILAKYKFTVAENTPLEEDVALDPEMLGMVFENLLAEIDPDENVAKSAKKASGSFYTPRKIIDNMVNESLLLYLGNYFKTQGRKDAIAQLHKLIYADMIDGADAAFKKMVVVALCSIKVLDPACGSGAFPMGMLHRIVSLLNIVDPDNHLWLDKQLAGIEDKMQRVNFEKILSRHMDDYSRKLGIIKDAIYGIDIQPLAVMITKLRFFISLLIEQNVDMKLSEDNYLITPMPNLETKILCADSLKDVQPGLFDEALFTALLDAKGEYYQPNLSPHDKEKIADDIVGLISKIYPNFAPGKPNPDKQSQLQRNKKYIHEWFEHGNLCAPFFNQDIFFPELKHSGFDIVIGNPPYGGTDISDDVKTALGLGSKDPYAAFIARFLGNGTNTTPLKPNGILAYIVSDTFMTIKTHKDLRQQMMNNYIHKMIRVHPDTFKATVNTAIIICERNLYPPNTPNSQNIDSGHHCQMVDMTTISIHDNYDRFMEVLYQTEGFEERENISTPEYAIYFYPQSLIKTNSNIPFFVASPKLFSLMNELTSPVEYIRTGNKQIVVRKITFNDTELKLTQLSQIADVKVGLQTGDNETYLFQNPEARGTYRDVNTYKSYLLTENDINKIMQNSQLRLDVIEAGVSIDNPKSARYFGGRHILPYDKGGESDSGEGWMPNYFVPTNYFIDWSELAVSKMKSYTIADKMRDKNSNKPIKPHFETTCCAVFRNTDTYFKNSITFSDTGVYAPTFRVSSGTLYDVMGMSIFLETGNEGSELILLGIMASKLIRYRIKNYINHTVHTQVEGIKSINILLNYDSLKSIERLVAQIIHKQKTTPRYDYASNEQVQIDRLIYEAYSLNENDICEVENWYCRRYSKLASAQEANRTTPGN